MPAHHNLETYLDAYMNTVLPHVSRDRPTNFLANGGTLENAQAMADHASPRTTQLYDRTGDEITVDEVERIAI